jgi:hypothetical protein
MSLQCPACREKVPAENVNIVADLARCTACGNVFRPGTIMTPDEGVGAQATPLPESANAPEGTRVQIKDRGGVLVVRFPPFGFNTGVLFLIVFAVAWWSFLGLFIGFGISAARQPDHLEQPKQTAIEAKSPLESDPATAETNSSEHGDSSRDRSGSLDWGFIVICLFMLPFFLVGFAVILAVLRELFARTQVRLTPDGCSYRRSLLGLGGARTASVDDTRVRWMDEPRSTSHRKRSRAGTEDTARGACKPQILLGLGSWEMPIGGHLSLREQEWVLHEMHAWLKRHAERSRRPRQEIRRTTDLRCPACGGDIYAEHVNAALNDATCPHCHEPFRPSCALPPASPEN